MIAPFLRLLLPLCVALSLGACGTDGSTGATYNAASPLPPPLRVAVLPFRNLTDQSFAGLVAQQVVETELYGHPQFLPIEQTAASKLLMEQRIDPERLGADVEAAEVGRALGVDAVVFGSVFEYGYRFTAAEEPVAAITLRMVSTADAAVLWAASHAMIGEGGVFDRDSLGRTVIRLVADMVRPTDLTRASVRRDD